jgi:hypothetical protein
MELLIKKDWDYTFIKSNDKYVLSVLCGTIGLFEIEIVLNNEENEEYRIKGNEYIDSLAKRIQNNPSVWMERVKM